MWVDVRTIIWRDLRSYFSQFERPRRVVLGIIASALLLVLIEIAVGIGGWLEDSNPLLLIWVWCWLPLGSAVTLATDAIAGERERHTLETLLATRIPSRAILIGKVVSVTMQAWLSAIVLGVGALIMINVPAILTGDLILIPWIVFLVGPTLSLVLTFVGVIAALMLSMHAQTVRQANFRILMVTTLLPVVIFLPLVLLAIAFGIIYLLVARATGLSINAEQLELNTFTIGLSILAVVGILAAIALGALLVALRRFTRHRLVAVSSVAQDAPRRSDVGAQRAGIEPSDTAARFPRFSTDGTHEPNAETRWRCILIDARVVAWKELVEARGLLRDVRGWLVVVGLVLGAMALQLTAVGSWYWSRDADVSIVFWLAMAAGLPLVIAQRSADAVAGERERHTGEILFTTRLSHTGIVVGKLAVTALMPWGVLLSLPLIGVVSTNLFYGTGHLHMYPADVFIAGAGLSLGVAVLFASGGMLISLGAPTVQQAARRMSWFLMPILIAPGLVLRRAVLTGDDSTASDLDGSGMFDFLASGEVVNYILLALPFITLACGILIYLILTRFRRERFLFS